ncbi:DUF2642 domain-containing protein [Bacillus sp. 165]|uniref:DUF2642 domain-containing protein n=1 Tax=Bacillus sp. 165 TaxID=1529117 RepID=UPI001ADA434B|nr:DUF2642 domain-containing protein [Bacillus sp. 165]MBO9128318.1 DUF2642 domain-containing protein [Bacillus sp. 165]
MINFQSYLRKPIQLTLSGEIILTGVLIDIGTDILVVYTQENFLYIPFLHIQRISFTLSQPEEFQRLQTSTSSTKDSVNYEDLPISNDSNTISLRKILQNAKGLFTEIFVTNNETIHGYVTHIMNNYFVFYSPVYKTMYIPFQHLKWLIPYGPDQVPYDLKKQDLPLQPASVGLARTFEEQLKKFIGKIVVFDLGAHQHKVGKLISVENNQVELTIARSETIFLNLHHIKTLHCP